MKNSSPPIIGVMGGSEVSPEVAALARELGGALATEGWTVLSGGRDAGVMAAVSEGAASVGGLVVGILPDRDLDRASPHLTVPIVTGLGEGRNVLNILSSYVVVALPGAAGTLSEIAIALKNRKPLLLLGWPEPPIKSPDLEAAVCGSVAEVIDRIRKLLGNAGE